MSDDFDNPHGEVAAGLPSGFRAAVTHALADLNYTVASWEPDGVNVVPPTGKGDEQYIGLSNLYRRARAVEKAEWPAMIREFLGHLTGVLAGPKIPDDLTAVADRLRPRLGRPFSRQGKTHPWGVPLPGTGLEINLVIDFPHTMAYVTDDMLKKTGRAGDDLLDGALGNLRANTPDDFLEPVSDEIDIRIGHTGDGYDAARALLVEDLMPESPAGFWVAVPSRDELAVWPVSVAALEKIHVIKMFARDNFANHAYPVSEDVFWVWRGAWYPFGIKISDTELTVSPPDEFMVALESLNGGTPGGEP
ncbi:hypothetical protein [Gemmata sp.]|uniref:hypothetical protein n=1 Tax=Gemmata sp. TaxID=1914242 RepID=UPI003F6E8579